MTKGAEAAVQRCSYEKLFWKYAANLQDTSAKVRFLVPVNIENDDNLILIQKELSVVVLIESCSKNMQQIYRGRPMPKCFSIKLQSDFIEITLRHGCSPVYLLHIFRTRATKNTSGEFFLKIDVTNMNNYSSTAVKYRLHSYMKR